MKQRLGLSLLGGGLALAVAGTSAFATPAGGAAVDRATAAKSDTIPVGWRGGFGFGFGYYPGYYGYGYRSYSPYYSRPNYYRDYDYSDYRPYYRHRYCPPRYYGYDDYRY